MSDSMNGRWVPRRMREYTRRMMDMMDDGIIDPKYLAESLLVWMSEDDAREFFQMYFPDEE